MDWKFKNESDVERGKPCLVHSDAYISLYGFSNKIIKSDFYLTNNIKCCNTESSIRHICTLYCKYEGRQERVYNEDIAKIQELCRYRNLISKRTKGRKG